MISPGEAISPGEVISDGAPIPVSPNPGVVRSAIAGPFIEGLLAGGAPKLGADVISGPGFVGVGGAIEAIAGPSFGNANPPPDGGCV